MSIYMTNLYGICIKDSELRKEFEGYGGVRQVTIDIINKAPASDLPKPFPQANHVSVDEYWEECGCSAIVGFRPIMIWEDSEVDQEYCDEILKGIYRYLTGKQKMPVPTYYCEAWSDC